MKHNTLLFLIQDDQVLLAMKKRGFGAGRYNGVGGKVEPGESIEEAAIRECQEEIEVTPSDLQKVAKLAFQYPGNEGQMEKVICHIFVTSNWEGSPTETEEMAPQWFYADMLPFDQMWPDDRYWLPLVMEGQHVTGEFTFDSGDEVVSQHITVVEPSELT